VLDGQDHAQTAREKWKLTQEEPSLILPENVSVVRLRIGIDPDEQYQKFAVEVRTGAGRAVWSRENLRVTDRGRHANHWSHPSGIGPETWRV
jgi:hypothetical protein